MDRLQLESYVNGLIDFNPPKITPTEHRAVLKATGEFAEKYSVRTQLGASWVVIITIPKGTQADDIIYDERVLRITYCIGSNTQVVYRENIPIGQISGGSVTTIPLTTPTSNTPIILAVDIVNNNDTILKLF